MNEKRNFDYKRLHPFKWYILENFPFLEDSIDVLTNYQLFCKLGEMYNKEIDAINTLGIQVEGITDWFDNLDVQDEVNNKLDEMAESGELEEIIATYLNTNALICFDTVNDMKNAENLVDGSYARTLGFYAKNDEGGSTYKIRAITNDDVIDGFSIIEMNEPTNTLIAELIINDRMNISQLGVHQDNSTDDSDYLQSAFNFANSKNIELFGNMNPIIISKSIYIPAYLKINKMTFKTSVSANNFRDNYMIGINTSNMSTWDIPYPTATKGYMKNCELINTNQSNIINGIYNFANNEFENLRFEKLNISFRTAPSYLDTVRMKNFQIGKKIGTDYAIFLGYLGDECELDTAHMYETIGSDNFINIGNAHNPINLRNLIANGKITANNSIVNISNIHSELTSQTQLYFDNCQVNIENGYLYHVDSASDSNIHLTNFASAIIKNVLFCYFLENNSYENSTDVDINVSANCELTVINCFKTMCRTGYADNKYKSSIKTNLDKQPSLKNIKMYNNAINNKENTQDNWGIKSWSVSNPLSTGVAKWHLPSGTYYYRVKTLIDYDRKISQGVGATGNASLALTNNGGGFMATASSNNYRIYRGTRDGVYDVYADVSNVNTTLIDNGYMINGYKWQSRTAGDVDAMNTGYIGMSRTNQNNVTLVGVNTASPSIGSWISGDIIYSTNASYKGWICTADGTPGTWKAL